MASSGMQLATAAVGPQTHREGHNSRRDICTNTCQARGSSACVCRSLSHVCMPAATWCTKQLVHLFTSQMPYHQRKHDQELRRNKAEVKIGQKTISRTTRPGCVQNTSAARLIRLPQPDTQLQAIAAAAAALANQSMPAAAAAVVSCHVEQGSFLHWSVLLRCPLLSCTAEPTCG